MIVAAQQWRAEAEALRATHPVFDHLGARQIEPDRFEVWLVVRTADDQPVQIRTEVSLTQPLPSLVDLWAGAGWCEREASEGYDLQIGQSDLLLLAEESERGIMRRERVLAPRQQPWPGSHEPSGRSRLTPLGRA